MAEPEAGKVRRALVIGDGSWGTTLAILLARNGIATTLWSAFPEQAEEMARARRNERFLPGVALHGRIRATADLSALASTEAVLLVTPAQTTREMTASLAAVLPSATPLVLCAKGIERQSGAFLCDVVAEARSGSPDPVMLKDRKSVV